MISSSRSKKKKMGQKEKRHDNNLPQNGTDITISLLKTKQYSMDLISYINSPNIIFSATL